MKTERVPHTGCVWIRAWIGPCKREREPRSRFCVEHKGQKCFACRKQATKDCYETLGSMVCGMPHCDKHPHGHN